MPMPGFGLSPSGRTGFTHCTAPCRTNSPMPGGAKRSARRVPTSSGSVVCTKIPISEMFEIDA